MEYRRVYNRNLEARRIREEAAEAATGAHDAYPVRDLAVRSHLNNGEEDEYRNDGGLSFIANFTKGLSHNCVGEVVPADYIGLLEALSSGSAQDFADISLGTVGGRRLTNPQAGLAFDLENEDPQLFTIPPAPRIDEPEGAGEMGELYWMAAARDVSFSDYGTGANTDVSPLGGSITNDAAASLSDPSAGGEFSVFLGPRVGPSVQIETLFRGIGNGVFEGPFISQFLVLDVPYVSRVLLQRYLTVPATNFLTTFPEWLSIQNGQPPAGSPPTSQPRPGPPARYIANLRDLATYVHFDTLYEEYLNAALILLNMLPSAPFDKGNPYVPPRKQARTQEGFGTFGGPHLLSLLGEVGARAVRAVWYQKWQVHRRLRPEEFGGRIHVHLQGVPADASTGCPEFPAGRYPMLNPEILNSLTAGLLMNYYPAGSGYLLPQAFAEGSPVHPSYGAGHATVAGACCTILKAWFDEGFIIPDPQTPDPATGFTTLMPAGGAPLTVGGEINKLAANIALGRNAAGVHYRSDYTESILLGEEIAIRLLQEQKPLFNEDSFLSVRKFDGTAITI